MILVTICARGGSKGVPKKNIRLINNKPLIEYSIDIAKEFAKQFPAKIALSTDSQEIIDVASKAGITTDYVRPEHLATDTAGKIGVIKDIFQYEEGRSNTKFSHVLDLDVTSPLRTIDDIVSAFKQLEASDAYNIYSVSHARKNPYFNMVEIENGYAVRVKQLDKQLFTRQSAPKVYEANASFYIYKRSFFEEDFKSALTNKTIVYVMPNICFDVDEEMDFVIMKHLIENNLVKTI
jgi:CMP-N,N'-diacetyllegionaminic acid synthase